MDCLITLRSNLNEKQFTQLAYNKEKGNYVVSAYFRCTNKFQCLKYIDYERACAFYEILK